VTDSATSGQASYDATGHAGSDQMAKIRNEKH
jgi:hypothetical protein